jgi:WD40 repeat protein
VESRVDLYQVAGRISWHARAWERFTVLKGHQDWVNAVCLIIVNGRQLLATASNDSTVRL